MPVATAEPKALRGRSVRWCPNLSSLLAVVLTFLEMSPVPPSPAFANELVSGVNATNAVEGHAAFSLPAGTVVYLRLETLVSTKLSHLRAPVTARVVRDVWGAAGVAIPSGTLVRGRLDRLIPSSSPTERARALLRFTELDISNQPPLKIAGRIAEVENARESILQDGTIEGVLANELPLALLEKALGKLGEGAADLQKTQAKALGKSDTSIDYPGGTDLKLVLTSPLVLDRTFAPTVPDRLATSVSNSLAQLLSHAPQRAEAKDGAPGDPLNLVLIGNLAEINAAFRQAGWSAAEEKNSKAVWETIRAVIAMQGYGKAPVSQLYLFGRHEDIAFEKMLNTFAKRHHLRLWRSPATTPDGREIWLGAATHDTGIDLRPSVLTHAIDPDLDSERAKVGADLAVTARVTAEQLVWRPEPVLEGVTATGAPWKTDGRLLAIELRPGSKSSTSTKRVPELPH